MTDTIAPQLPEQHPERHDPVQQDTRGLWIFIAAFVVFSGLVALGLYGLLGYFVHVDAPLRTPAATVRPAQSSYPEPRIQGVQSYHPTTPRQDMAAFLAEEHKTLTTYGPTTKPGYGRIPVNRAMDLALSKSLLPVSPLPTTSPAIGRVAWPPAGRDQ